MQRVRHHDIRLQSCLHQIGKMQDMYEKQKSEVMEELSEMKTVKTADIIRRIKDVENGLKRRQC